MGIEEQIARLEVKAVKAEEAWRSERERFERIRAVCDTNAEAICRMNVQWMESVHGMPGGSQEADGSWQKSVKRFERKCRDLKGWPHRSETELIHLQSRLKEAQFELKWIENQMYDCAGGQRRKLSAKLKAGKERCMDLEQAQYAVEQWEILYLMFIKDLERRRDSWMDERFYEMERKDIRAKMARCAPYCDLISKMVASHLRSLNQTICGSSEEISDEIVEEIEHYSVGILFLEYHLYNCRLAAASMDAAAHELDRLKERLP